MPTRSSIRTYAVCTAEEEKKKRKKKNKIYEAAISIKHIVGALTNTEAGLAVRQLVR